MVRIPDYISSKAGAKVFFLQEGVNVLKRRYEKRTFKIFMYMKH